MFDWFKKYRCKHKYTLIVYPPKAETLGHPYQDHKNYGFMLKCSICGKEKLSKLPYGIIDIQLVFPSTVSLVKYLENTIEQDTYLLNEVKKMTDNEERKSVSFEVKQ